MPFLKGAISLQLGKLDWFEIFLEDEKCTSHASADTNMGEFEDGSASLNRRAMHPIGFAQNLLELTPSTRVTLATLQSKKTCHAQMM